MDKKSEFLQNIITSVKSKNIITTPKEVNHFYLSDNKKVEVEKSNNFDFSIRGEWSNEYPRFSFDISIVRVPNHFLLKNRKDSRSWYVTKIRIQQMLNQYSSWSNVDEYFFDSKIDNSQEQQKELFQILMDAYKKDLEEKQNQKINLYIKEAKKLHPKDVVRDEKLDKLLSQN